MGTKKFNVRVIANGKVIDPSEYKNVIIVSPSVDKIVNSVYDASLAMPKASNS